MTPIHRRRAPRSAIPAALAIPAGFAVTFLLLPLLALVVRAPWSDLRPILSDPNTVAALRLSVVSALAATAVALPLGVPLAWVLARSHGCWVRWVRALVIVPLVLPPVVGGVGLLLALGREGLVGRYLNTWFGISLPFTTAAVIIAMTFVSMPFLVVTVEGALRSADLGLEEASATLGATRWYTATRVTFPLVAPSLAAGAVLTWARALGEFGATITFAGNFPGTTQTMPLAVYLALESDPQRAVALSLILLVVSIAVLAALRDKWLRPGSQVAV